MEVTESGNEAAKGVSLRKIEANRRNAQYSTGPKTATGKQAVKRNALKHGLLSKEVVIPAGDGKESKTEYATLLAELQEAYEPVGMAEELLVEEIATCYWRLRRVLRCETGEIRKRVDTVTWGIEAQREQEVQDQVRSGQRDELRTTCSGVAHLLAVLAYVRSDIREAGELSEATQTWLLQNFDWDAEDLGGDQASGAKRVKPLLRRIDQEQKALRAVSTGLEAKEALELKAKVASLALPSSTATDKILRYEAAIQRRLAQVMNQLERLQQARKGARVLPPISVSVSQ